MNFQLFHSIAIHPLFVYALESSLSIESTKHLAGNHFTWVMGHVSHRRYESVVGS